MATEEMHPEVRRALSLGGDPARLAEFYDDWADRYDDDLAEGYGLPQSLAETLLAAVAAVDDPDRFTGGSAHVLDAGCGTGIIGEVLASLGYTDLHGVDLSEQMVDKARERGTYTTLEGGVDLTAPPARLVASADIVTLGGVLTSGHVPPEALTQIASLAKPGGLIVASARQAYLDDTDFVAVQQRMCDDGELELIVHREALPYTRDSVADYFAWRTPVE